MNYYLMDNWWTFGIIAYFISMIGVYEPWWRQKYNSVPGIGMHIVVFIACAVLGYISFVLSLIVLLGNMDLWIKKK